MDVMGEEASSDYSVMEGRANYDRDWQLYLYEEEQAVCYDAALREGGQTLRGCHDGKNFSASMLGLCVLL